MHHLYISACRKIFIVVSVSVYIYKIYMYKKINIARLCIKISGTELTRAYLCTKSWRNSQSEFVSTEFVSTAVCVHTPTYAGPGDVLGIYQQYMLLCIVLPAHRSLQRTTLSPNATTNLDNPAASLRRPYLLQLCAEGPHDANPRLLKP